MSRATQLVSHAFQTESQRFIMFGLGHVEVDQLHNFHFGFSDRCLIRGFSKPEVCLTPYPEFQGKSRREVGDGRVGGRSRWDDEDGRWSIVPPILAPPKGIDELSRIVAIYPTDLRVERLRHSSLSVPPSLDDLLYVRRTGYLRTIKGDSIRVTSLASLDDARQAATQYVHQYNSVRIHSAIGYVTSYTKLAGKEKELFAKRDEELDAARGRRRRRQAEAIQIVALVF